MENLDSVEKLTILEELEDWTSNDNALSFVDSIFSDKEFTQKISDELKSANVKVASLWNLLGILRNYLKESIGWGESDIRIENVERLSKLAQFEARTIANFNAYSVEQKINPDAVFWPNPTRTPPRSLFETLPMVKNFGIIDKNTPVGSAGSCFAFEIAYNLQRRGFRYVVTEFWHQPENGVFGDVSDVNDPNNHYTRFSANWGILFNTPSFRQVAEASFGERKLPKLLVKKAGNTEKPYYADPFRENIFFKTPEDYEKDYDRHLEASRRAFLESKVFIITPGLNECWQYTVDGSVISRNPGSKSLMPFLKHRTLSVEENIYNLQRFIDIIRAHNKEIKFVLSISPIPFLATGLANEKHVVVANSHSKAVLRVAADEICRKNKDVFYFPSYEMVTSCIKDAWEPDQRHVTRAAVDRVMGLFDSMFVRPS